MIRKNSLNYKLNLSNHSSKDLYEAFKKDFNLSKERCPTCNAIGQMKIFDSYDRYIVDFRNGKIISDMLTIPRALCTCGHTHGILTDFIVPYRQYSLPFILQVLKERFINNMTLEKIHEIYGVSHKVLKKWKDVFRRHRDLWLGIVRSRQVSFQEYLDQILSLDPYSGFAHAFYLRTLLSFLQTHANPANCRHHPPGFLFSG